MIGTENLKITHPSSPVSRSTEDFFPSFNMVAPSVLPLPPKNLIRLLLCSFCAAARRDAANSDNTLFVHASYTAEIVNNSTSARKYCAQPAALMAKGQYFYRHKTPPVRSTGGSLLKTLAAFRQWRGERKSDHFLRRHVRRRKYFSACKRARRPPPADGACAAVRPQILCQKVFLFDRRNTPCAAAQGVSAMVFF